MANVTPVVYDAITKEHKPANVGDHISPAFTAVDPAQGNLLQNKVDAGLGVFANDMVSPQPGNLLTTKGDGKLFVEAPETAEILSKEAGNYLRYGNDKGLFLDGNDVLSNGTANLLHISRVDGKVELTADDLKDAGVVGGVSKDAGNLLTEGSDGGAKFTQQQFDTALGNSQQIRNIQNDILDVKDDIDDLKEAVKDKNVVSKDRKNVIYEGTDKGAYLSADDIVDIVEDAGITKVDVRDLINLGTDPLLTTQGDKLVSGLQVQYNEVTGRLDILGVHGNSIAHTQIPTAVALLESVNLEDNPSGQPAGTYIHFVFRLTDGTESHVYLDVNKLAQFYTAGDGIEISPEGVVSVNRDFVGEIADEAIDEELQDGGSIKTAIEEAIEANPSGPSTDAGNALTVGSDNKLFYKPVTDYGLLD